MLGRKSFLVFTGTVLASALSFIGLFFITNFIGAEAYGTVTLLLSILAIINVISDLGFSSAHLKRISEGKNLDDCVSSYIIIKINLICLFIIFSFVSLWTWLAFFNGNITEETMQVFIVLILYNVFSGLAGIASTTFQGESQIAKVQLLTLIFPLVRVPLIIIIALIGSDALDLAVIYLLAIAIALIVSLLVMKKSKIKWTPPTLIKSYLNFAMPLAIMSIIATFALYLDKILIGFSMGEIFVGYYFSAQSFISVVSTIGSAVAVITYTNFSKLFVDRDYHSIKMKSWIAERYISMLAIPIIVPFIIIPDNIMAIIFGGEFRYAGEALRWLSIATLIFMMNQPYSTQIPASDRSDIQARNAILSYLISLILMIILIPSTIINIHLAGLGMLGAALSYLGFTLSYSILTRLSAKNISGTGFNPRIGIHIISGLCSGLFLSVFISFIVIHDLISIIMVFLVSLGIFYFIMIITKEFHKSDIIFFADILNIRKMIKYIISEVRENK